MRNDQNWLPTSAEAFFLPLLLCYVFFFLLQGIRSWLTLTMPLVVLLLNATFIVVNFSSDKNLIAAMRQSVSLVLAFFQ